LITAQAGQPPLIHLPLDPLKEAWQAPLRW
jgi:hypothetical protein